ncbi:MAG: hypothetical protein P1U42_01780 [Phycisphaerales bacterium]|nr:hypothetical protein [Phycisphaerales bacterium]
MNRFLKISVISIVFALCYNSLAMSSSQAQTDTNADKSTYVILNKLNPLNPVSYLIAGEALGARAQTEQQEFVASQALILGAIFAYQQGDQSLAASMCIAIAAIEPDAYRSQELWDLAIELDPQRLNAWREFRDKKFNEDSKSRQLAAKCIAAARFGDTKLAAELFNQSSVHDLIIQTANALGLNSSALTQTLREMLEHPDDECRGRVFVVERSDGEIQRVVCQDHRRPLGAADNDRVLRELLQIELELVTTDPRHFESAPWSLSEYLDATLQPVRDPSLNGLLSVYRVDETMPYWKHDKWVSKR